MTDLTQLIDEKLKICKEAWPGPWQLYDRRNTSRETLMIGKLRGGSPSSSSVVTPAIGGDSREIMIDSPDLAFIQAARGSEPLDYEQALRALKVCVEALAWYAEWDWSDKYVQPVPKASIKALAEVRRIVGVEE